MTEEQKEILIAKMLDTPSSLSDKELDMIADDDELRDIYDMSALVSGSYARQPDLNMDYEWQRFRPQLRHKPSQWRWIMRVAAIFLGIMVVSGIMVRLIDRNFTEKRGSMIAQTEQPTISDNIANALQEAMQKENYEETVAATKISMKPVIVSKRHIAKTEANKSEETQIQDDADIDEFLRVQQARIDNDIALIEAEIYESEFNNIISILEAMGENSEEIDNAVRQITMQ